MSYPTGAHAQTCEPLVTGPGTPSPRGELCPRSDGTEPASGSSGSQPEFPQKPSHSRSIAQLTESGPTNGGPSPRSWWRSASPTSWASICQSCGSSMRPENGAAPPAETLTGRGTNTSLSAGVTLRAADALRQGQETFTSAQVAYLVALAFESGRTAAAGEDLAETVACWVEHANPRRVRGDRVAARVAEMEAAARRWAEQAGRQYRPYRGGPVDWETGQPVRTLGVAA